MSKKYLSIEEAAEQIGISSAELNRLREKGQIRAFADRGTWKFKEEDVEKLARSRQADSDPDVPIQSADEGSEDSSSELVFSDDDALGAQPTIISKVSGDSGSDSDVRLIFDDSMQVPEPKAKAKEDSDSDVKLAGGTPADPAAASDSDVKLVTDAEVEVGSSVSGSSGGTGSDSDVRLVSSDSSGEVKLAKGAGDSSKFPGGVAAEDSGTVNLSPAEDSSVLGEEESGISLAEGSGIALASDSGISLERPNDSGISLADESSVILTDDSGISLADEPSGVKGKKKGSDIKKRKGAKAAGDSDDLTGTIPLMDVAASPDEDLLDTQMEVPMMGDSSAGDSGDETSVITLDDDEDAGYEVTSVQKKGAGAIADDDDVFGSGEAAVVEDTEEEAVDVADEIIGEDDELGEDVFGAEDEDFAGEPESGESLSEIPVSPRGMAAPVEQEWGAGPFTMLSISAVLMIICGTVMFDLVRNMWHTDQARQNPVSSFLLNTISGSGK